MNYESESDSEEATPDVGGGGCKSGTAGDDGGLVDVEDIGVVMKKAKNSNKDDEVGFLILISILFPQRV